MLKIISERLRALSPIHVMHLQKTKVKNFQQCKSKSKNPIPNQNKNKNKREEDQIKSTYCIFNGVHVPGKHLCIYSISLVKIYYAGKSISWCKCQLSTINCKVEFSIGLSSFKYTHVVWLKYRKEEFFFLYILLKRIISSKHIVRQQFRVHNKAEFKMMQRLNKNDMNYSAFVVCRLERHK